MCLHCHVLGIDLQVKDLDALEAACKRLGWTFHRNADTFSWFGHWVDDSPVPQHLFDKSEYDRIVAMTRKDRKAFMTNHLNQCDHKISIPDRDYDIALRRHGDHYRLFFDTWHGGLNFGPLLQAYGAEVTIAQAATQAHLVTENQEEDGTLKLTIDVGDYS